MTGKYRIGLEEAIGNTPLVEIRHLNPHPRVKVWAKLESSNPGGSIKDRVALRMIQEAERRGDLSPDKIILEATSGNTGIGLAMIAAARGYRLCLAMPESASEERKKILRAYGAELIFTPSARGTDGAIETVYQLLRQYPGKYFGTDQFNNPDNVEAHYHGTAEEIWRQTGGTVSMVVVGLGTSGTAMGISRKLKEYNPRICIAGVEPYHQHKIQGLKNMKESYRPGIYDKDRLDKKIHIQDEDAFVMARRIAKEEGILVGMSSGAALHVAFQLAAELDEGVIVVIFPDGGERYLSTELFADRQETGLKLLDAQSRDKILFRPLNAHEVLMHTCGPTVHEIPHLGHYRRFVVSDVLHRYLVYRGYPVKHAVSVIDLADKSILLSEQAKTSLNDYTDRFFQAFLDGMAVLNVCPDILYGRATDHHESILGLVERLVNKGFAYEKLRSVYFDISKMDGYGQLSHTDLSKGMQGRVIALDDYEKDSPGDFVLLKRSSLAELKRGIFLTTRWGSVRPSWHAECAAIAKQLLGESYDIHMCGSDVLFPHGENVMAIGRADTGKRPAHCWLQTELVMVGNKKMSRSLHNTLTIPDLARLGYNGREIRFFLLSTHYRKPLHFSLDVMDAAKNSLEKLDALLSRLRREPPTQTPCPEAEQILYDVRQGFQKAMDDDLNMASALAILFTFVRKINKHLDQGEFDEKQQQDILDVLESLNGVLGVMNIVPPTTDNEMVQLLAERERLRQARRWQEADLLREQLRQRGVVVSDGPQGVAVEQRGGPR